MKNQKIIIAGTTLFVALSILSLLSVSLMAFVNPQMVMDLVGVSLTNTDAFSSIRGVYGGVGMTIVISLTYLYRTNPRQALGFLILLWGFYAISRTITIFMEGPLGDFGSRWLLIEIVLFIAASMLYLLNGTKTNVVQQPQTGNL